MTYVQVTRPRRRRRKWRQRLRRVPWTGLLWIGGSAGVLVWYARRADVDLWHLPLTGLAYLVLLGAALVPDYRGRSGS